MEDFDQSDQGSWKRLPGCVRGRYWLGIAVVVGLATGCRSARDPNTDVLRIGMDLVRKRTV